MNYKGILPLLLFGVLMCMLLETECKSVSRDSDEDIDPIYYDPSVDATVLSFNDELRDERFAFPSDVQERCRLDEEFNSARECVPKSNPDGDDYVSVCSSLDSTKNENDIDVSLPKPTPDRDSPFKDLRRDSSTNDKVNQCRRAEIVNSHFSDEPDPQCLEDSSKAITRGHPDQYLITPQIAKKYGYNVETYDVKTADDYYLTVYRLPPRKNNQTNGIKRYPVYMQHGLVSASDTWFLQPPNRTLVFKMVDQGYDVWLGNSRGTSYSRKHATLSPEKDLKYWDFSFHELGIFDVPAITNFVIEKTGFKKILYIGYSMGTTSFFVTLSEYPEMNKKFAGAFLMTPTAFLGHGTSALHDIAKYLDSEQAYKSMSKACNGRLESAADLHKSVGLNWADVCAVSAARCGLCDNIWFYMHGYNPNQMNKTAIPLILTKMGNTAGVKILSHYAQLVVSCKFQKYSYNPSKNRKMYGSLQPPEYNLGNIKVPLHFYYSRFDNFVHLKDMHTLTSRLSEGVLREKFMVKDDYFTHMDFGMGKDADRVVYAKMLKDLSMFDLLRRPKH